MLYRRSSIGANVTDALLDEQNLVKDMNMINPKHLGAAALLVLGSTSALAETTANGSVTNNYLWRGLTQSNNEVAAQGGIDWSHESGFYVGTWVSNVEYASDDTFSYEHDVYFGYSGGDDDFNWDVGYLYYNYDDVNNIDFSELYGGIGVGGFSATLYVMVDTEAEEGPNDFGFGSTTYLSLDYGWELDGGATIGLHVGRHDGDFNDFFNFGEFDPTTDFTYTDYSFSVGVGDFTFTISDTDLDELPLAAQFGDNLDNDDMKFVISYGREFEL